MKLTRIQALELHHILDTTKFDRPISPKFMYAVTKNLKKLKEEIDAINDAFPTPESYNEYRKKEVDLFQSYSVNSDKEYNSLEDERRQELDSKIDALKEEYADVIEEFNSLQKEKSDFVQEDVEIELFQIDFDLIPSIAVEGNQYDDRAIWDRLLLIIKE